jgi:hypothetical protein
MRSTGPGRLSSKVSQKRAIHYGRAALSRRFGRMTPQGRRRGVSSEPELTGATAGAMVIRDVRSDDLSSLTQKSA